MGELNTSAAQSASQSSGGGDWLDRAGNWLSSTWDKAMHEAADSSLPAQALHGAGQLANQVGLPEAGRWLNAAGDGASTLQYNATRAVTDAVTSAASMAYNLSPEGFIDAGAKAVGLPVPGHAPDAGAVLKPLAHTIVNTAKAVAPYAERYAEGDPTLAPELAHKATDAAYNRYIKPFAQNDPETGFNHVLGDAGTVAGVAATVVATDGLGEAAGASRVAELGTLGEDAALTTGRVESGAATASRAETSAVDAAAPNKTAASVLDRDLDPALNDLATRAGGIRTAGIGITDVPGLQGRVFEAGSTGVRKALGSDLTPGSIRAPYDYSDPDYAAFVKHAEEEFGNQYVKALQDAGYKANANGVYNTPSGTARFYMNASDYGVCNNCLLNLRTPSATGVKGVVQQLSEKVPNVKFVFQTAGKPANTITVMGGKLVTP